MGKERKIEVDDSMPCNKNEDYILPSCYKLSELWPAIFTKAIFKIHSYKRMNTYTEEVGDISILYNLTGYICEKIPANSSRILQLNSILCNKENYLNKFKLFAAVKFDNEKISLPNKSNPNGPSLYCAVIVKKVDSKTRSKTSINDLLRD